MSDHIPTSEIIATAAQMHALSFNEDAEKNGVTIRAFGDDRRDDLIHLYEGAKRVKSYQVTMPPSGSDNDPMVITELTNKELAACYLS